MNRSPSEVHLELHVYFNDSYVNTSKYRDLIYATISTPVFSRCSICETALPIATAQVVPG